MLTNREPKAESSACFSLQVQHRQGRRDAWKYEICQAALYENVEHKATNRQLCAVPHQVQELRHRL